MCCEHRLSGWSVPGENAQRVAGPASRKAWRASADLCPERHTSLRARLPHEGLKGADPL